MRESKKSIMDGVEDVKSSKLIMNNTVRYERNDGAIVIRLHHTDIIVKKDGNVSLYTGGWKTVTTKDRLNNCTENIYVYQEKSIWYVQTPKETVQFFDGITIDAKGNILNPRKERIQKRVQKETKDWLKKISKYCKKVSELPEIPIPNAGDCWFCLMFDKKPELQEKPTANSDHIMEHLNEQYIHGSIILNAMKDAGYQDTAIAMVFNSESKYPRDIIVRAIRRYFKKRLGIGN